MSNPEYLYDARNGQGDYKGSWITYDLSMSAKIRKTVKAPRMKFFCNVDRNLAANKPNPPPNYTFDGRVTTDQLRVAKTDAIKLCAGDTFFGVPSEPRYVNRYKRNYDPNNKMRCCMGDVPYASLCDPKWKFNTAECDTEARKYCQANPTSPKCGCMLPESAYKETKLLGPPECIDSRCAGNSNAYKTQDMLNRNCPNIVNCVIDESTISNLKDSKIGAIQYEQKCGISVEDAIAEYEKKKKGESGGGVTESSTNYINLGTNLGLIFGSISIIAGGILYKN